MKIRIVRAGRGLFALATAVAVVGLVVAHVASGPAVQAASDDLVATGPGEGGSPHVRTFGPTGTFGGVEFSAAGSSTSGATVAVGDVTGDGAADIVTGTGSGTAAIVQVRSRDGATVLASAPAFPGFQGGVNVATAAIDAAAGNEIIIGAGPGGGPHVRVLKYSGGQLTELTGFYAYSPAFTGGVYVAGVPGAVVTGAGAGGGPHVRVLGVSQAGVVTAQAEWMALGAFTGGVRVAAGDVTGDAANEVIAAAGPGGGPIVRTFNFTGVNTGPDFYAYSQAFRGGVWVATSSAVRNPSDRIITGAGPGGTPHVRILSASGATVTEVAGFLAYVAQFGGGVRVAGFPAAAATGTTTTTAAGGSTTTTAAGGTTTTAAGGPTTTTCLLPAPAPCVDPV